MPPTTVCDMVIGELLVDTSYALKVLLMNYLPACEPRTICWLRGEPYVLKDRLLSLAESKILHALASFAHRALGIVFSSSNKNLNLRVRGQALAKRPCPFLNPVTCAVCLIYSTLRVCGVT